MPVYNERESIKAVIEEWLFELKKFNIEFTLCVLNDGSKDDTLSIIQSLKEKEIFLIDKPNTGHGQSCILGYKTAIEHGAEWVFQIDSDGQCDPRFFKAMVEASDKHPVIFGYRKTRDDGFKRFIISRIVSIFAFFATGIWVKDANVPYRLMRADYLKNVVSQIPSDFHLANIFVSVLLRKQIRINWINIHFRDRTGGSPSVKTFTFAKHGFMLFKQLRKAVSKKQNQ